jgi:hypothetical protein
MQTFQLPAWDWIQLLGNHGISQPRRISYSPASYHASHPKKLHRITRPEITVLTKYAQVAFPWGRILCMVTSRL